MSLELVSAIAAAGTFIVIAASAVAALVQLRHMRSSNQIIALNEFRETLESREINEAQRFVSYVLPERLRDPQERIKITTLPFSDEYVQIGLVANFFENMGEFVRHGIVDPEIACDLWAFVVLRNWKALAPLITYMREVVGAPALWTNFEYLAVLSGRYGDEHPNGVYPPGFPRMPEDRSLVEAMGKNA